MFNFFIYNDLIFSNFFQSGFTPGHSSINQVLLINEDDIIYIYIYICIYIYTYKSFDFGLEIRDISLLMYQKP